MSIKIIKPGRSDWEDRFLAICRHCGAEFLCNKNDGKYVGQYRDRPDEGDFVHVNCPNCGRGCVAYPYPETYDD